LNAAYKFERTVCKELKEVSKNIGWSWIFRALFKRLEEEEEEEEEERWFDDLANWGTDFKAFLRNVRPGILACSTVKESETSRLSH
jgi:hypothetical protein